MPRAQAAEERVRRPAQVEGPLEGTETILLVEDDEALRALAKRILSHYGYRVLDTTSVEEALERGMRHQEPVHLLVTDVVMPRMSGPELARKLGEARPELRVLYMSGYSEHGVLRPEILEQGFAYIQKPFTSESLARKVRSVLEEP